MGKWYRGTSTARSQTITPTLTVLIICLMFFSEILSLSLFLSPLCVKQGDANRSYSDDDRSSCNFDEKEREKDPLQLSGMKTCRSLISHH